MILPILTALYNRYDSITGTICRFLRPHRLSRFNSIRYLYHMPIVVYNVQDPVCVARLCSLCICFASHDSSHSSTLLPTQSSCVTVKLSSTAVEHGCASHIAVEYDLSPEGIGVSHASEFDAHPSWDLIRRQQGHYTWSCDHSPDQAADQ